MMHQPENMAAATKKELKNYYQDIDRKPVS